MKFISYSTGMLCGELGYIGTSEGKITNNSRLNKTRHTRDRRVLKY
jgi:hypothetical protein